MNFSKSEQVLLDELQQWENKLTKNEGYELPAAWHNWAEKQMASIPPELKNSLTLKLDTAVFHLNAFLQSSSLQLSAREQILKSAAAIDSQAREITDLRNLSIDQLNYIADIQLSKQRLYSLVQGGLTGAGGLLFLGADLPAAMILQLRTVQTAALCYGYELNTPYETMTILRVYHAALLPGNLKSARWKELTEELYERKEEPFFYDGPEEIADEASLRVYIGQIAKLFVLSALRKKVLQGIPVFGLIAGAGINYKQTREVAQFAQKYYQLRTLSEKKG
ncbi:EcsC family protein [Bacillus lacus]|uniref:EcsC family protein n=1 Tax=Metabacillus lacus TaxID=1983721 RepID=A0A7X2IXP1_9BACI|nr:EcsC family protein [Metabacillus lacus]MRX71731.1 EcsC family protein [Metabacillus lacus]